MVIALKLLLIVLVSAGLPTLIISVIEADRKGREKNARRRPSEKELLRAYEQVSLPCDHGPKYLEITNMFDFEKDTWSIHCTRCNSERGMGTAPVSYSQCLFFDCAKYHPDMIDAMQKQLDISSENKNA